MSNLFSLHQKVMTFYQAIIMNNKYLSFLKGPIIYTTTTTQRSGSFVTDEVSCCS